MKMVTLSRRDRSIMICQKLSRATGSAPEVGSSRMSISATRPAMRSSGIGNSRACSTRFVGSL